ncbi:MAG: hypothetical protein EOO18_03820 [Chryseobacterium sp.]|nr:MAG: hypothetical protein EOO18_03820 [Chryseobacterium sp.]
MKNLNEAADQIEAGQVAIVFADEVLQTTEVNLIAACFVKCKSKPYIISLEQNFIPLTSVISKDLVGHSSVGLTESFMFNSIRNLLTPAGRKLDIRYIRGIVVSVVEVIRANTQCTLSPKAITEIRAKETPEDISSVLAFCGDGFLGSLTITTGKALMTEFAVKMIGCEPSDANDEMLIDIMAELTNQIAGAVRNNLSEFGYSLSASMAAVVIGEQFLNSSTSNGSYYTIPFDYNGLKFNIVLCYNTYTTSIKELEVETGSSRYKSLDVRLANAVSKSATKLLGQNFGMAVDKGDLVKQGSQIYSGDSLHVFHAASWQGKLLLALDVPRKAAEIILKNAMGMEPSDVEDSTINDYFGEIINQVAGDFLKVAKKSGYSFQRIYQGGFSGKNINYNLKNPGYYYRQTLFTEQFEINLIFGLDSTFATSFFNIWPYFMANPLFSK